ncbi:cytochrome c biogenesis protein CcsA [Bremerella cremea]|uniref:cytochrome c biogenesis protein CcsA n=1 Tax=Bremerella cremea TaxID=1031537 RepID=UPI0031ED07B1
MLSGITLLIFAASYAITLGLEIARIFVRARSRAVLSLGFAVLGLAAHTFYLVGEQQGVIQSGPISSWHQWCLMAAWVLVSLYVIAAFSQPGTSLGLFLLPLVLLLVGVAYLMDRVAPFSTTTSAETWGVIHGTALLAGTVIVMLGFVTGIMYLIQSYRLKHKMLSTEGFKLPSLEWLEMTNRRALVISTCLLAGGLFAGILLKLNHNSFPWTDPVIWSSAILFSWLVAAMIFELVYRPARRGQKVAYLTMANFMFLALVLGLILFGPSQHARNSETTTEKDDTSEVSQGVDSPRSLFQ